jgi:hypothetical protein
LSNTFKVFLLLNEIKRERKGKIKDQRTGLRKDQSKDQRKGLRKTKIKAKEKPSEKNRQKA